MRVYTVTPPEHWGEITTWDRSTITAPEHWYQVITMMDDVKFITSMENEEQLKNYAQKYNLQLTDDRTGVERYIARAAI